MLSFSLTSARRQKIKARKYEYRELMYIDILK